MLTRRSLFGFLLAPLAVATARAHDQGPTYAWLAAQDDGDSTLGRLEDGPIHTASMEDDALIAVPDIVCPECKQHLFIVTPSTDEDPYAYSFQHDVSSYCSRSGNRYRYNASTVLWKE